MDEMTARERARLRKQRSRASQAKTSGLNRFEIIINDQELAALERGRVNCNPGVNLIAVMNISHYCCLMMLVSYNSKKNTPHVKNVVQNRQSIVVGVQGRA
jgi:hypothetical protein